MEKEHSATIPSNSGSGWSVAQRVLGGSSIAVIVLALLAGVLFAVAWFSESAQSQDTTLFNGGKTACSDGFIAYFPSETAYICLPAERFVVHTSGTGVVVAAPGANSCAQTTVANRTVLLDDDDSTCRAVETNAFVVVTTAHAGTPSTLALFKFDARSNGYNTNNNTF
jgi:hypothetical protein